MGEQRPTVLAIGLDAAEPQLVDRYIREGHLPNLARLRDRGAWIPLDNFDVFSAELPWTTFITGCAPWQTGYWTPLRFQSSDYRAVTRAAYEYDEFRPFYALGDDCRVAIVDLPQARLSPDVNGVQVMAWGAHSPQGPTESSPPGLMEELNAKHGPHPALHDDYGEALRVQDVVRLRERLVLGIQRRGEICRDLLSRETWDLFITVFGETHSAGHNFLQVSDEAHPLYDVLHPRVPGDPLLETYAAIDTAIGRMLDVVPESTHVLVFSAHGMGPNTLDLPSCVFLPELLYRWNFPGKVALQGRKGDPLPGPYTECDSWMFETWLSKYEHHPVRRALNRFLPWGAYRRAEPWLGTGDLGLPDGGDLISPFALRRETDVVPWQPAHWYSPLWPRMKAFALPSFSEGYIRLNVIGRDGQGLVRPEDYVATCDEIIAVLETLRDSRRGTKMVRKALRMRDDPLDDNPRLPDADIVIGWQDDYATDCAETPAFGRMGPFPHIRAGSHRHNGWAILQSPAYEARGAELHSGHALDLAPTILSLLGRRKPDYMQGESLTRRSVPRAHPVEDYRAVIV